MRKYTWKHTKTANGFDSKIILHNYILYQQAVADPGFPRGGGANSPGGVPT